MRSAPPGSKSPGGDVLPETCEMIRLIFDKFAEAERDNISSLMKIVDIFRA